GIRPTLRLAGVSLMTPGDFVNDDPQSDEQILQDAAESMDEVRQRLEEALAAAATSVAYIRLVLVRRNGGAS
ncbi:MAG: hypothetical protein ACRDUA_22850, partial [Micromonosporaceae bacterium]